MILIGLMLSALGLATIITVVLSELTANRYPRNPNAHLRARFDRIVDEEEEDRKIIRVLATSVIGGLVLLAGFLVLTYGMILG